LSEEAMLEILICILLLIGGSFVLLGSIGLARLPDFFTRLHGPTKSTTLGLGSLVLASIVHTSMQKGALSWKEMSISLFLFITAPVSAHLMLKTASSHKK
jgi:multicomponent K+:H+ antiporter subunit G